MSDAGDLVAGPRALPHPDPAMASTATTTAVAARLRGRLAQVCGKRPKMRTHAVPVPSSAMRTTMSDQAMSHVGTGGALVPAGQAATAPRRRRPAPMPTTHASCQPSRDFASARHDDERRRDEDGEQRRATRAAAGATSRRAGRPTSRAPVAVLRQFGAHGDHHVVPRLVQRKVRAQTSRPATSQAARTSAVRPCSHTPAISWRASRPGRRPSACPGRSTSAGTPRPPA